MHFISGLVESKVKFVAADMPEATVLTIHIMAAFAEHESKRITPTAELYKAYWTWAREAGWKNPMTRAAFGRRLAERGIQLIKGGAANTKCACDIALNLDRQNAAARHF
ncbi:putative phage resolvase/recombinase for integration and excision [Burkholderia aenigmatica]|uniref:Phage resolvase/recombinase for integration and excision n=1 Tax=Burkholderia aenigmatica TaxID=2015348 RepID=A0ABY6XUT7_9BURK|nr:putative phage resolvase/recombinase for integration and excision [Burkholderia aenigmatica]VWD25274.1 putative phage resolvase/recombinase for integration and excision [Burkholderia aenigmatica]